MQNAIDVEKIKISNYPADYIPAGAQIIIGVDQGSPEGDYTVKGFYDPQTGEYHIQEVVHNVFELCTVPSAASGVCSNEPLDVRDGGTPPGMVTLFLLLTLLLPEREPKRRIDRAL